MSEWVKITVLIKIAVFITVTIGTAFAITAFFTEGMNFREYTEFKHRYRWSLLGLSAFLVYVFYKIATPRISLTP